MEFISYSEETIEGSGSGCFTVTWTESTVEPEIVINKDGITARVNRPVVRESLEELRYSNPQQRSAIEAFIAKNRR